MNWINVSIQSVREHLYDPNGFLGWRFPKDEWRIFLKEIDCSYSPSHYNKNNMDGFYKRADLNVIYGSVNSLMLDFDDGLTIKEALEIFKDYDGVIATTKSHQKEKNGIVYDRFRVIIPMKEAVALSKEEYSEMMSYVMEKYPQADKACKNISRFYFSNKEAEIFMLDGDKLFDWKDLYSKEKKLKAIEQKRKSLEIEQTRKPTITFDGTKIEYLRSISMTDKILDLLKFEKFSTGGRNNYLYSVAMYLRTSGMSDKEIVDNVFWINNKGDSLSESEICRTIFRSMRIDCSD